MKKVYYCMECKRAVVEEDVPSCPSCNKDMEETGWIEEI